jgi:hypothetical protein
MTISGSMQNPRKVDESQLAAEYGKVLSQVAAEGRPVIVQRGGVDFAMLVPLEYLELIEDSLARKDAERIAARLDWKRVRAQSVPPQHWFEEDEPKPF